jgi:hypothetical protein
MKSEGHQCHVNPGKIVQEALISMEKKLGVVAHT